MSSNKPKSKIPTNLSNEINNQREIIELTKTLYQSAYNELSDYLKLNTLTTELFENNKTCIKELNLKIAAYRNKNPQKLHLPKQDDAISNLVDFLQNTLESKEITTEDSIVNILKGAVEQEQRDSKFYGDSLLNENYTDAQLDKATEIALAKYNNENCSEYKDNLDRINNFEIILKLLNYDLPCNMLRQSFISIFSIFDASLCDYLKNYFMLKNSDDCLKFFYYDRAYEDKIKCINEHEFKFAIERLFTDISISNLLFNINKSNRKFFDRDFKYNKIVEILKLRNLHVHNNGIVDQMFFDKYKSLGFSVGDTAYIDDDYLENTFKAMEEFENRLDRLFPM